MFLVRWSKLHCLLETVSTVNNSDQNLNPPVYVRIGSGISSSQHVTCLFSRHGLRRIKCIVEDSRADTAVTLTRRPFPIFCARIQCKPTVNYRTMAGFLELGSVISCTPDVFVAPPYLAFSKQVVTFRAHQMCSLHRLAWPSISRWWHFVHTRCFRCTAFLGLL
jgi:hypothetical protein